MALSSESYQLEKKRWALSVYQTQGNKDDSVTLQSVKALSIKVHVEESRKRQRNLQEDLEIAKKASCQMKIKTLRERRLMSITLTLLIHDTANHGICKADVTISPLHQMHDGNCGLNATHETCMNVRFVFKNVAPETLVRVTRTSLCDELYRDTDQKYSRVFVPSTLQIGGVTREETYREFVDRMMTDGQFCEAPCLQALACLYDVKIKLRSIYYALPHMDVCYDSFENCTVYYPKTKETSDSSLGIVLVLLQTKHDAPHFLGLANVT